MPGSAACSAVEDIPVEEFDMSFDVLVRGVFLGMKHAIPIMKKQGSGSIINTGSIAAVTARRGPLIYSVCKAAVVQLSKVTAMSLGEHSIRVNAICPGYIATPLSTNTVGGPARRLRNASKVWSTSSRSLVSAARKTLPTWRSISPATDPLSLRAKPSWSTAGPRLVCSGKTRKTSTRNIIRSASTTRTAGNEPHNPSFRGTRRTRNLDLRDAYDTASKLKA